MPCSHSWCFTSDLGEYKESSFIFQLPVNLARWFIRMFILHSSINILESLKAWFSLHIFFLGSRSDDCWSSYSIWEFHETYERWGKKGICLRVYFYHRLNQSATRVLDHLVHTSFILSQNRFWLAAHFPSDNQQPDIFCRGCFREYKIQKSFITNHARLD